LANTLADIGVAGIIDTDIERDGMLSRINLATILALAQQVSVPIIVSGGAKNLNDTKALLKLGKNNIAAVIAGRSLYEGTLDLAKAQ
jgi:phosphoribosylformimino-5-aminoimidazole carboxamide ribotide isomerase